jgi:hypothetical protein
MTQAFAGFYATLEIHFKDPNILPVTINDVYISWDVDEPRFTVDYPLVLTVHTGFPQHRSRGANERPYC